MVEIYWALEIYTRPILGHVILYAGVYIVGYVPTLPVRMCPDCLLHRRRIS